MILTEKESKEDLEISSLEEYHKEKFLNKLEKSKKKYEKGQIHNARIVLKELREICELGKII